MILMDKSQDSDLQKVASQLHVLAEIWISNFLIIIHAPNRIVFRSEWGQEANHSELWKGDPIHSSVQQTNSRLKNLVTHKY